jgi:hypothetical protein
MDDWSEVRPGAPRVLVACALALTIAGCATTVKVTRTRPAELDLAGLENVAVLEVGGDEGRPLANEIARRLFEARRLNVVDQSALVRYRWPAAEAAPPAGAPAAALVLCEARIDSTDDVAREETSCARSVKKDHLCFELTRTVTVSYVADLKVVDSRTGRLLVPSALRCARSEKTSAVDALPDAVDLLGMVSSCREDVASRFLPLLVPTAVEEEVVLVEDDALPSLAAGNRLAKVGDWGAARGEYLKAAARADADGGLPATTRAKAHYAVGLSLLLAGRFDESIGALATAAALADGGPARELLQRARAWQADAERLRKQTAAAPARR